MYDDEKIEQIVRQQELLTEEGIEAVRDAIREAAEQEEELSFLDAAVRKGLLSADQADEVRGQAEQEIATSETEDISEAIPGEPIPAVEGEQEPRAEEEAAESETREGASGAEVSAEGEQRPAAEEKGAEKAQKPHYVSLVVGIAILVLLIILVAVFNR